MHLVWQNRAWRQRLLLAIKDILIHPDPRLKAMADPVSDFSDALSALADDMLETMYAAPGIGLAAPQVGVMKRLLVMDCVKDEDAEPEPMVLVNPRVIWTSDDRNTYEEGCLSIPDQYAEVERPAEVEVAWQDLSGADQSRKFDGLWATCVQHEIDHLDGKLFIDYLSSMRRSMSQSATGAGGTGTISTTARSWSIAAICLVRVRSVRWRPTGWRIARAYCSNAFLYPHE